MIQPVSAIIDGRTITAAAGPPIAVIDPASADTIVTIAEADEALVDRIEDRICQDEIFGPFAAFTIFDTAEEAYRLANGTRFGLVSYVWSQDIATIMEAQDRLSSGIVWCNTPMTRELRAPSGGFGDSGVDAEGDRACEAFYTGQKTVSIPRRPLKLGKLGRLEDPIREAAMRD